MPELFLGDGREKAHGRKEQWGAETLRSSRATRALLAQRLQAIRKQKGLSKGDISSRTALRMRYVSRVENGRLMPRLHILERWAHVLEVPLYQLFYDGKTPPQPLRIPEQSARGEVDVNGSPEPYFNKLRQLLPQLKESNQMLLLNMAQAIYRRRSHYRPPGVSPGERQRAATG